MDTDTVKPVKVLEAAGHFRVVEDDGTPVMSGRLAADGGGFVNKGSADRLVEEINARRTKRGVLVEPDQPVEFVEPVVLEPVAPEAEPEAVAEPETEPTVRRPHRRIVR